MSRFGYSRFIWVGLASSLWLGGRASAQIVKPVTTLTQIALETALEGGGDIQIQVAGTIALSSTLQITSDTTLEALDTSSSTQAVVLSGPIQLIQVQPGVNFTVKNLAFSGGLARFGAGLYNDRGATTVINCVFSGDAAAGAPGTPGANGIGPNGNGQSGGTGGGALGGAIYNAGTMTVNSCQFVADSAIGGAGGAGGSGGGLVGGNGGDGGGGGPGEGGAIYNSGVLTLANSILTNNVAAGGVGGTNGVSGGSVLFAQNGQGGAGAAGYGGAVFNSGTLFVTNCSFLTNYVAGGASQSSGDGDAFDGGSGYGGAIYNSKTLAVGNSTFATNGATGGVAGNGGSGSFPGNGGNGGNGEGGAIYSAGTADLLDCTLAGGAVRGGTNGLGGNNGTFFGNNGSNGGADGANLANQGGTMSLRNTILAYPTGSGNAYGTITDKGHNLSSDNSASFRGTGSINGVDPLLLPPADNGGVEGLLTMAVQPGSRAIGGGDPGVRVIQDEIGTERSTNLPTIGAFEFNFFSVSGQILDAGAGLPGITVTLGSQTTTTDTNGDYAFSSLVAGTYPLSFGAGQSNYVFSIPSTNVLVDTQAALEINVAAGILNLSLVSAAPGKPVALELTGPPSQVVALQATSNFTTWTNLGRYALGTGGTLIVTDFGATNAPYRFYQLLPAP